jgi:hypothetical protein
MCVFGSALDRIDFDRIEFGRIDFDKIEFDIVLVWFYVFYSQMRVLTLNVILTKKIMFA